MASIHVDSHDILGALTLIKNYLSVVKQSLDEGNMPAKEHVDRAYETNEDLIRQVKKKALDAKSSRSAD